MSCTFSSSWAERLYKLTLETWQADELGEAETFGWYAHFPAERTILWIDSLGFVYDKRYASRKECNKAWRKLELEWAEFVLAENEEEEYA